MTASSRPGSPWAARVSHYTSPQQLTELEQVRSQAKADSGAATPVAALLRAATDIGLNDPQLRQRMIELARTTWR